MFVRRKVTANLSFHGEGGALQNLSYNGFRVQADIRVKGPQAGTATVKIYGLSESHMNALSRVPFRPVSVGNNTLQILAGDENNGMSVVFEGTVIQAWPDMQKMPEVYLRIDAVPGAYEAVKPVDPTSFSGATQYKDVASKIIEKFGLPFENNNIQGVLMDPYYWGTARQQMMMFAQDTRLGWIQENGIVAVWPKDGHRTNAGEVYVSPETGMVTAPMAAPGGIIVRTLFNKSIKYASTMRVKSRIKLANGSWTIAALSYQLDAETPHGGWFATIYGVSQQQGG